MSKFYTIFLFLVHPVMSYMSETAAIQYGTVSHSTCLLYSDMTKLKCLLHCGGEELSPPLMYLPTSVSCLCFYSRKKELGTIKLENCKSLVNGTLLKKNAVRLKGERLFI